MSIIVFLLMTTPAMAVDQQELTFMREFFNGIQQRSFDTNREYCGFVGVDEDGYLITTEPTKGEPDACYAKDAPADFDYFASYHTHGAFSEDADSELPSSDDLIADIAEGIDGFVATPGGRVWFNDSQKKTATLVCENCVMRDPNFNGDLLDPTEKFYTVETLKQRDNDQ
ncbi:MAG: DUF4329 domain-containing protein [Alphaproteobacteria bacterium]|nr:DUF4329 domain-containing protein [Alphaproteobacteria bacterium]